MVPKVVFILGGPGAGKGTHCKKISKEFNFVHLSAGDLLREECARPDSEYGALIEEHIREGKIVPVDITCSLLERAIQESANKKFLIDGFPRNEDNLEGWNRRCAKNAQLLLVLYFNCPLEVCSSRCLRRGAGGSGRSDDNAESLHKRFHTYLSATQPIINRYKELNLVREIDSTQRINKVWSDVKKIFNELEAQGDFTYNN
ncbi:hypothetical protein RI129_001989 [Pyrocoelia pectoralis]|uniref:UMP-CMP kinase n=1 Tax=Pyrocoelia pectoralis TaxID=417401 RepID=A0AAN7ZKD8_9COLE